MERDNFTDYFSPIDFFGISQDRCLLFLKLLDNSNKAKQDILCRDFRYGLAGLLEDKTDQDHLGKRGCTESGYWTHPRKEEQEEREFVVKTKAWTEILTVSSWIRLSVRGIIIIKANIHKLLITFIMPGTLLSAL